MQKEKEQKRILGLPKNIFILGATSFFNDFSSEMIYSVFPAFFTSVLNAGAGALGFVDGVAEAASNFFKIYSGRVSDRFQKRKPFVVVGYSISVFVRPFYMLAVSVGGVFGLRFLDRVGKGLRDAPRDAIISLSTDKKELGRAFGYHRAMDTLGAIVGPLVAYFILRAFPMEFNIVFVVAFGVGLLALMSLFFIKDVYTRSVPERLGFLHAFRELSLGFKWYLLAVFVLSLGVLPIAVVLLKTQSVGLLIAHIPLLYMVYNLSFSFLSYAGGSISDRIGERTTISIGYVCLLIAYTTVVFANTVYILGIGFLILGLFSALTDGVQRSLASRITDVVHRGEGLGWLSAAKGFGALFAGIFGGLVWQFFGPTLACLIGGYTVVAGLILFLFATRTIR